MIYGISFECLSSGVGMPLATKRSIDEEKPEEKNIKPEESEGMVEWKPLSRKIPGDHPYSRRRRS
jgi:hypothetical protein